MSLRWTEVRKIAHSRLQRERNESGSFKCSKCDRRFYHTDDMFQAHMLFDHGKVIKFEVKEIKPADHNAIIGYSMREEIREIKRLHRKNWKPARNLWHFSIRKWFDSNTC